MVHEYDYKPGDVIAFSGSYLGSDLINLATQGIPRWSASHVGIVANPPSSVFINGKKRSYRGIPIVFESYEEPENPCVINGMMDSGVQGHNIGSRIRRYKGKVWVYPLSRTLYPHESHRLTERLFRDIDKPYDKEDVTKAGGILLPLAFSLFRKQDFSAYFCSELVASKLSDIGLFLTSSAGKWSPNSLVRALRKAGVIRKPIRLK